MGRKARIGRFAVVLLCLLAGMGGAVAGALDLGLAIDPASIARGSALVLTVTLDHAGTDPLEDITLSLPLPTGFDQWASQIRIDGGGWFAYPANGLIPLGTILSPGHRTIEVRAFVEHGAPGTLVTMAQIIDAVGVLAEARGWVNVLPWVDAGADLLADRGEAVVVRGASAGDGGDGIAAYAWTDGGAGGMFDDPAVLHPRYSPATESDVIELTLTATDHDGGSASDSLRLRVNSSPIVDLGPDRSADEGEVIDLDDASASDDDGWIVSYAWSDGGVGGSFRPSADVLNPVYQLPLLDGCENSEIELTLTAVDNWGAEGSDSVTVSIANVNVGPSIDAGSDQEASEGDAVSLVVVALDADGEIAWYHWEQTGGPDVSIGPDPWSPAIGFEAPDVEADVSLHFSVTVSDECGETVSDSVTVVVIPEREPPHAALTVQISAFDARGFPLWPFDAVPAGEPIWFRVKLTNTGELPLRDLSTTTSGGKRIELDADRLDPWESAQAVLEWEVGADGTLCLVIDAVASDSGGRVVTGSDSFTLHVRRGDSGLALEKTADRTEASVGETVVYSYEIRNAGTTRITGLSLFDDRLGRILLPATELAPGALMAATCDHVIAESELPGPLVDVATASGFTTHGDWVEAEDTTSVELSGQAAGGGGATSAGGRLVISEIAWAGTPVDPDAEWIEIVNVGPDPVDLSGWRILWYEKGSEIPPESAWSAIDLRGRIDPLPSAAGAIAALTFVETETGVWRVVDPRWEAGSSGSPGCFLLERGHDNVVSDVAAGMVYDGSLEFPDGGAAMFLVDPDGTIVDSANAQYPTQTGWPAGETRSTATMERIALGLGDYAGNWQTHPGMLMNGRDARDRPLRATAGKPNSPSLEALIRAAESQVAPVAVARATTIPLPGVGSTAPPTIQVVAVARGPMAGGGGAMIASPEISTRRSDGASWLDVDLGEVPGGTYFIWISYPDGETFLLPLLK